MTVSILIPIYNVERYVARCLRSVFEQSYYDIEYVLLGKTIESSKKKEESIKYQRKTINIAYNKLSCKNENQKGYSNIYLVLDNLLPLKK